MNKRDTTYNGWTNYETWAVKLWIDNEQGTHEYWREAARDCFKSAQAMHDPSDILSPSLNAERQLAERLKDEYSNGDHPVFQAANNSVYADLVNAALSAVNWYEIAESLLEGELEGGTITGYELHKARK